MRSGIAWILILGGATFGAAHVPASGQVFLLPYKQNFDSVTPPTLPPGWTSTQNRTPGIDDFTTTSSTPRSAPNAVVSTNATIAQALTSPALDFFGRLPDEIEFYTRRTATHLAKVVLEASLDSGNTFALQIGDTLQNPGHTNYVRHLFVLPETLRTSSRVMLRWRIIADVSGSTGTFRIDDVGVTVQAVADLSLARLQFSPALPVEADSVLARATILNLGLQTAESFLVEFYIDANNDSIPQPLELVSTVQAVSPLVVADSVELSAPIGVFPPGRNIIIAKLVYQPDENLQNNQRLSLLLIGYYPRSVVINEIMYAPTGTEPEWVELYNTRSDSISLKDWLISDNNTATKRTITTLSIAIPPTGYVVLTRDSAALLDIHPTLPSRVFNVSGFPTLNNSGDAVVLYDNRVAMMDSLTYAPGWGGNTGGRSLERIDPLGSSTTQTNWGTSRNSVGSTPGVRNSISRKDFDLTIDTLVIQPTVATIGDSILLRASVTNIGLQSVPQFQLLFFEDANGDSIPQPSELTGSVAIGDSLQPLASTDVPFVLTGLGAGTYFFITVVHFAGDEDTLNNKRVASVTIGYPEGVIRINEIMYAPAGEPEWVEFQNIYSDSVDIRNWKLANRSASTRYTISSNRTLVPPVGFLVVTKDSALLLQRHQSIAGLLIQSTSLPTFLFSNNGDAVVLYDNRALRMDSVFYSPFWGGVGGRSLERVEVLTPPQDSTNWRSSTAPLGSTPGRKNTVTRKENDLAAMELSFVPPFPIVGDSVRIICRVLNNGLATADLFTLRFFEDINMDSVAQEFELIRSISSQGVLLSGDSVEFSTVTPATRFGERRFIARVVYPTDEDTLNNIRINSFVVGYAQGSIRINEIMYAPPAGIPEWVELINVSPDTIDLKNWKVGNRSPSSRYVISASALLLPPAAYMVVAKDTALIRGSYAGIPGLVVQASSLPTFLWNNGGDAVVLLDGRGGVMDSVLFSSVWGGTGGVSLERIDALSFSTDSANWSSSVDSLGGTPGRANSVVAVDHDLRALRASSNVSLNQIARLSVTVQNVGKLPSSQFQILLYDDANGDSLWSADELFSQVVVSQSLSPRDTLVSDIEWMNPGGGLHNVIARIDYPPDSRLSNNVLLFPVRVGYAGRMLVIDEVMFAPSTGNAEYVEMVNVSDQSVDLRQWTITDRPASSGSVNESILSSESSMLQQGEIFVLASDSSILTLFPYLRTFDPRLITVVNKSGLGLNNDGDDIVLRDLTGAVIDSVSYLPAWHNPGVADKTGRSLEKINPRLGSNDARNWSTCANPAGGTPGLQNSIHATVLPSQSRLSFSPNPFSPDGDGHEDFTIIQYEIPLLVSVIRVRIYDVKGRLIRTVANNEPAGSRGQIVWDGRDDSGQKARIGMYIVLFEAIDDRGGIVETTKAVVVLAGRL
ncbi:MAG: lamin tail domain-containing protein [Ignavibacteriae bacterium]|nr:lamin tail domain-containing protein [Ignavibacteriota bacterium]